MKKVIYLLALGVVAGCQPTLIAEFEDKPVVSCFLDAGTSPVLTISKLIAFRDDAVYSDENVNALSITITDITDETEITYPMQPAGSGGKYENPLFIIQAAHTYRLDFTYNRKPITATATVPDEPQNVAFSTTSVGIFNRSFVPGSSWNIEDLPEFDAQLEITWENEDRNFYMLECFTTSTEVVNENQTDAPQSFKADYTQNDYAILSSMQFRYYGDYEVSLVRIQPEYAVMSEGSANTYTSASIDDVKGNIDGGYGIFTGISRTTQTITVYAVEVEESTE